MKVVSLNCPGCAASVNPDKRTCESCGSYYGVIDGNTALLSPAVRLLQKGRQFTFVYGPRKFFLMGRHCIQAHVPIRHRGNIQSSRISRKAVVVTLTDTGPIIQRVGASKVIIAMDGTARELSSHEQTPLISGMDISFGLKDHVWNAQVLETASGKIGVLFSEPGDKVRHLLIKDNVEPADLLRSDELIPLGVVRRTFTDPWIPTQMEEENEHYSFPAQCDHVWQT